MPKIQVPEQLFYAMLSHKPRFEELEKALECAKAEIDEPVDEEGFLKIELNDTNRPDLWSTAGLARHLNVYKTPSSHTAYTYDFFSVKSPKPPTQSHTKKIVVDTQLKSIRPYVLGFIIQGKTIDQLLLDELIQLQEKLCENFGHKRKSVAIGIYREDLIQWPVHYVAADPHKRTFVPLDSTEHLPLQTILKEHPKGKEYGHLLQEFEQFPLLEDTQGEVLSMPPVINSAHIGAVQEGDTTLFVECTGHNLEQLMLVSNIFACDCHDLGFSIVPVITEYPKNYIPKNEIHFTAEDDGRHVRTPQHFQSPMIFEIKKVETMLGMSFSYTKIEEALLRMNIVSRKIDDDHMEVVVPPYRNDFLHQVDVIEDVMIGMGMEAFPAEHPKSFTIGRLTDVEIMSRKLISLMVGLGFQEMIFPYLGSKKDFIEKMYASEDWDMVEQSVIQIVNPVSENYECVRPSIIPNLLESERVSAHSAYPHNMCEIGKTAIRDNNSDDGTRTDSVLGFLIADSSVGFTDINSILAAIFYYTNIEWEPKELIDSRFINNRGAVVMRILESGGKEEIGFFGELHPRVLTNYNITMPCVAGEVIIERML